MLPKSWLYAHFLCQELLAMPSIVRKCAAILDFLQERSSKAKQKVNGIVGSCQTFWRIFSLLEIQSCKTIVVWVDSFQQQCLAM
mmetsp:Transcript_2360/g.5861  ORF Transcript_2360/g.5861 Transcript_2360/m.5861 type:complete len:84 (+) Transcript_2360:627-878(+)